MICPVSHNWKGLVLEFVTWHLLLTTESLPALGLSTKKDFKIEKLGVSRYEYLMERSWRQG